MMVNLSRAHNTAPCDSNTALNLSTVSVAAEITEYLALRRLPDFDGLTRLVVKPLKSDTPATETIRRARPGDLLKPCRVGVVVS